MNEALTRLLREAGRVLVASHREPDGDALGATLGLMHLLEAAGKEVCAYSAGPVPEEYRFLPGVERLQSAAEGEFDLAVVVDCHQWDRVGPLGPELAKLCRAWAVVDHHQGGADADAVWIDPAKAATCQMLTELAEALDWPLDAAAATCFFVGLQTDTGSFRYSNTSPQALRVAAGLVAAGAEPWAISQEVYATRPVRLKLLGLIMDRMALWAGGRLAMVTVFEEDLRSQGAASQDLEQAVEAMRGVPGVQVAALLKQMPDGVFKLSMRSRGAVDVAAVAGELGGGGHHNAAGARLAMDSGPAEERVRAMLLPLVEAI